MPTRDLREQGSRCQGASFGDIQKVCSDAAELMRKFLGCGSTKSGKLHTEVTRYAFCAVTVENLGNARHDDILNIFNEVYDVPLIICGMRFDPLLEVC